MVISETGARRLFGDTDPIGETITVKHNFATQGKEIDVVITGIYKDFPSNSHFKCKYLLNVNALRTVVDNFDNYMQGSRFQGIEFFENYVVFKPDADLTAVEKELDEIGTAMLQSDSAAAAAGWKANVFLAPVTDLHFDQKNLWENDSTQGNKTYLAIFSSVAILILIIASINYMNLSTARSAQRGREVGLRKALGSKRSQIATQFFYESFLMTFGSLFIALLLVILLLNPFNQLAHKTFTIASLFNPYMIGIVIAIVLFMSFISGSYPSIYLSGFKPVEVLKGQVIRGRGAEFFRKTLVALQYTVALILIISTFVVIRQMDYMQQSKLNEQGSQLLSIRYGGTAPQNKFEAFREAVLQDRDIEQVTMANHLPRLNYFGFIGTRIKFPELGDKDLDWNALNVDFHFPKTYGLEFISGRDFNPGNPADSSTVILNEAAVKALNEPIEKVIGAKLIDRYFDFNARTEQTRTMTVIGVVKDFPFRSMHQAVEPLVLNPHLHFIDKIAYVKIPAGKFQEKIASIEKKWREIYGDVGFDYWFVSDEFNRMYESERRMSSLARSFAVLSILITALGIFGLAAYTAEQKSREVGIRKVLGAKESQVVAMFLMMFIRIFSIACVIGIPVAYLLANKWLDGFAYKMPVSPLLLVGSALGLLLITIATVGFETIKAANTNPVEVIRRE
jgi:putative ABC transport system permease protein